MGVVGLRNQRKAVQSGFCNSEKHKSGSSSPDQESCKTSPVVEHGIDNKFYQNLLLSI